MLNFIPSILCVSSVERFPVCDLFKYRCSVLSQLSVRLFPVIQSLKSLIVLFVNLTSFVFVFALNINKNSWANAWILAFSPNLTSVLYMLLAAKAMVQGLVDSPRMFVLLI